MAPSLVNSVCFSDSGTSLALVLPFTPAQGNKLLLCSSQYETSIISLITTPGVVWSKIQSIGQAPGDFGVFAEHWMGDVVGSSPGTALGITIGVTTDIALAVHEVSGLRDIWPPDQLASVTGFSSPAQTGQIGSPINPESYFFGSLSGSDSAAGTIPSAPSNSFTTQEECIGPNANPFIGHRVTSFDKIVSLSEAALTQLTYVGFIRWNALMTTLRGSNEPAKPIQRVASTQQTGDFTNTDTSVVLASVPTEGNTLLLAGAVGNSETILDIAQPGVVWARDAVQINGTLEMSIWRGIVGAGVTENVTISHGAASSPTGGFIVEEYSGLLEQAFTQTPLDQVATNSGSGSAVSTGLTGVIDSKDELIFGAMMFANALANFQQSTGFLRSGQNLHNGSIVGATFINDESFTSLTYQISADSAVAGSWAACIATYRNDSPGVGEGPPIGLLSAELNQGGTSSPVTSGSFSSFVGLPSGSFTDGHRYLILASARVLNLNGLTLIRLNVSTGIFDDSMLNPYSPASSTRATTWSVSRVLTLSDTDSIDIELAHSAGTTGTVRQINLVAIDLDSINIFEGRDWFYENSVAVVPDMDTTFANNVGATLRFLPDGVSDYLVLGHARMSTSLSTPVAHENVMRLRDLTNTITLAQGGWHKTVLSIAPTRAYNVMGVIESPPNTDIDLAIEMIGGGPGNGWQHEDSSITVIRLDAFASSGHDYKPALSQASPGNIMPPTGGSVNAQAQFAYEPDTTGDMVFLGYSEADNVADDADGLASQAQFLGVTRSLWDTENTVLGNVVQASNETNAGNYDTNDSNTRIPTFGVSRRTVSPPLPGTVQWFNGGVAGNASVIERVTVACLGGASAPVPTQTPPPDPTPIPVITTVLQQKSAGQLEEESLSNQLEQFKPGSF